jgi:hypothetical protein
MVYCCSLLWEWWIRMAWISEKSSKRRWRQRNPTNSLRIISYNYSCHHTWCFVLFWIDQIVSSWVWREKDDTSSCWHHESNKLLRLQLLDREHRTASITTSSETIVFSDVDPNAFVNVKRTNRERIIRWHRRYFINLHTFSFFFSDTAILHPSKKVINTYTLSLRIKRRNKKKTRGRRSDGHTTKKEYTPTSKYEIKGIIKMYSEVSEGLLSSTKHGAFSLSRGWFYRSLSQLLLTVVKINPE